MRKHKIEKLKKELFIAINNLDFEKVKRCIRKAKVKGVQKEIINGEQHGMAPIHFATYKDSPKILQFLLNNGANINAVSYACLVPFSFTVIRHDRSRTMEEVVLSCIHDDASLQGMQNFTALHLALYYCRLDIAKILLENGIDVNIRSTNGKTAFEVIPDYESLCSEDCDTQKILSSLLRFHKNNCKALLTSARTSANLELEAGDAADSAANPSLAPIKANIKIELEADNTTDLVNSAVNSSFAFTRANFKEASSVTSSAVKPFSFVNSIFSWIEASFSQNALALSSTQQVTVGVDFSGTAVLADVMVRKLTGKKYSMPLDDSLLTIEQIKERKLSAMKENFWMVANKYEKLDQCPGSSLSNLTISKGVHHQQSF